MHTLAEMLSVTAGRFPEQDAFVYGDERVSYAQVVERVQRFARGLASLGLEAGDPVALVLPNTPQFLISFFALAGLGAVVLPLNPRLKAPELERYFRECSVRAVITDPSHVDICRESIARGGASVHLIAAGERTPSGVISFEHLMEESAQAAFLSRSPDETVLFQYSSGSAGQSKRVVRTQEQCWWEAENFVTTTGLNSADRIFCAIPLFHAHGLGNCLLAAARSGATLILMDDPHPFHEQRWRALELIERHRATVFPGVPYLFHLLAEAPGEADLSSLRLCFSAGSSLSQATFEAFDRRFGVPIRQLYGCTEAGSITVNLDADPRASWELVGRPMARVRVTVVDDAGAERPAGEVGEVAIQSPAMAQGYVEQPDLNAQVFNDGWFFTGDLGRLDAEGRLLLAGRKKLFIDVRGNKVDPVEVEAVLAAHPAVGDAVVVGVKGAIDGEELVKAVVVRRAPCEGEELRAFCRERLASFKVPRLVAFRDEIPKSALGKVLRQELA